MPLDWRSKLIHPTAAAPDGFRSLVTPIYRGSTTLLPTARDVRDHWDQTQTPYRYGFYGTPTTLALGAQIAELEGGDHVDLSELYGDVHQLLGMGVSPDDCGLALRGLQTLGVRLQTGIQLGRSDESRNAL